MAPWDWPGDAGSTILQALEDDRADASERLLAAQLAGDLTVFNDELAHALLAILQHSSEPDELRGQAAISLGPGLEQADIDGFDDPDDLAICEDTLKNIQESFHRLHADADVPKHVRRRVLEASVRAPQEWHHDAVRAAYDSDDEDWILTAVFSMRWVHGFDDQILESLDSESQHIHYSAVCAAGNWELDAAWPHVSQLVRSKGIDKPLLLASIDAVASIRPQEAGMVLVDLTDSEDEEIVEAAHEAMAMAEASSGDKFDNMDDDALLE
jgi:hypothetical protein